MKPLLIASLVAAFASAPAAAQNTSTWSTPTRTEVWSQPAPKEESAPKESAPKQEAGEGTTRWAEAPSTSVHEIGDPEAVENPAPLDARLAGAWDVRVPTGVSYHTDGQHVVQRITPGSDDGRLHIGADGTYSWKRHEGPLREVRPWFAFEGQRYFEVSDGANTYVLRYDDEDDEVNLFYPQGGHVARGQRAGR